MAFDIRSMILDRHKNKTKLAFKDVNRPLVTGLLALSVYGREARDEEILSIIINAGEGALMDGGLMERIRTNYDTLVKEKKLKKEKDGTTRLKDTGFQILVPR